MPTAQRARRRSFPSADNLSAISPWQVTPWGFGTLEHCANALLGVGQLLATQPATASGNQALYSNTTGLANTASGYQALLDNKIGTSNTAAGYDALYFNTDNNNTATGRTRCSTRQIAGQG
jgi:hypothetical protein